MIVGFIIGIVVGWVAIGLILTRLGAIDQANSDAYDPSTGPQTLTGSGCTYLYCYRQWWPPFRSICEVRSCGGGGGSGSQH